VVSLIFGDTPISLRYGIVICGLAPLLAFSVQTTAGFSSMPCGQLDAGPKLILIFSMLAGGGAVSTAGGFKLLRLLIAVSVFRLIILELPADARIICYYRDGKFSHADKETTFRIGDEVVILTHSKNMTELQKRWQSKPAQEEPAEAVPKKNR
jgi:Trk-type K+ transport system membrane component